LDFAASHPRWDGVDHVVHDLARQTGLRIALTTQARQLIADSAGPGALPLPAKPSAVVDPLTVDVALQPHAATDRIDSRAVGPFLLPAEEREQLRRKAEAGAACIRHPGVDVQVVEAPSGRPRIEVPGALAGRAVTSTCAQSALASGGAPATKYPVGTTQPAGTTQIVIPTATEQRALQQLNDLVNGCLARNGMPAVQLVLDQFGQAVVPNANTDDRYRPA
jgi:two-component system sensor histidine kinase BaeS